MGKASRDKGKRGERELAARLRELGVEARRGAQHRGGPDSPDVVAAIERTHLEVKRTEAFRLYAALEQARSEAPPGSMPVVAHRRNRRPWVVVMELEDYVRLAREAGRVV